MCLYNSQRFAAYLLSVSFLFFSFDAFSGTPHKSKKHCWQSLARHETNICKFYAQSKAIGNSLLWGNVLIPSQNFIDTWKATEQRAYLYAVYEPDEMAASQSRNVYRSIFVLFWPCKCGGYKCRSIKPDNNS